jgi:hypothetical protein
VSPVIVDMTVMSMKNTQSPEMRPVEKLLLAVTTPPWCAVYLVPSGFLIFPIFYALFGVNGPWWALSAVFFGVLLALRFGPAVLRRFLPVSKEVRDCWFRNRVLAKQYDSYQWQKLFWFGWGIFIYAALLDGLRSVPLGLAAFCVVTGGFAAAVWRKRRLAIQSEVIVCKKKLCI